MGPYTVGHGQQKNWAQTPQERHDMVLPLYRMRWSQLREVLYVLYNTHHEGVWHNSWNTCNVAAHRTQGYYCILLLMWFGKTLLAINNPKFRLTGLVRDITIRRDYWYGMVSMMMTFITL